jgi:hypothetical protein
MDIDALVDQHLIPTAVAVTADTGRTLPDEWT